MAVARGRRDPLQGRGLGLDAQRGAGAAGLGRPRGARPRLRAARPARPDAGCCSTRRRSSRSSCAPTTCLRSGSTTRSAWSACSRTGASSFREARLLRPPRRERVQRPGLLNGDIAVSVGLTDAGVEQARRARRVAARRAGRPLRHDAARARAADGRRARSEGRDVPRLVVPELNDPLYGPFEGARHRGVPRVGDGGAVVATRPATAARAARDRRALRARLPHRARAARGDDPRRRALAADLVPARRARRPRAGREGAARAVRDPVRAHGGGARACGRRARRAGSRRRAGSSVGLTSGRRCSVPSGWNTVQRWASLDRIDEHIRRHDLIEPRGEVLVPRLRRARLDLPLPRAARARLPRLGAAREPLPARRGVRRGRALLRARSSAPRSSSGRARRDARPSCARSATATRPTGCARPATRLATRSRRSSTGSSTSGGRTGSSRGARTASSARCCRSGARRPRRTAASASLAFRVDSSNADTVRGLIRDEILPLLEQIHPAARENILRALEERRTMPPALAELLDSPVGSQRVDLGGGVQAVREYDRLWLEREPGRARRRGALGRLAHPTRSCQGLRYADGGPGDRLAGRSKKVQDVFVDAKVPRSDREGWPLVVRGDEVVAVPGIVEAPGVEAVTRRDERRRELERGRRRGPDRRGRAAGADRASSATRSRPTTPAGTCCSSACSRAPSSSWPT